ncbi:hypothetical protein RED65_09109 [Oceanobacter sp. RED65]|uniref:Transglutaminase-like domain-containing protein n=2 Tax=Bermanella marisrubri TaxID=207949 RepID=Q1N6Q4_9GAMM|nr:hypothetical protein RED65_09109 [Oceanobacter sp. RED65] [Bermanella marisrubri]
MATSKAVSQGGLSVVFISLAYSILVHYSQMPWWVISLAAFVIVWRYLIFTGKFPQAHWIYKGCLVTAGLYGVFQEFGLSPSIESTTVLLMSGMILKPLETFSNRDAYILIFLSYMLLGMAFLFDQTPLMYGIVLVGLVLNIGAQIRLHQDSQVSPFSSFKVALSLLAKSLPLAIFLFIVMPRLAPLWTLKIPTQAGQVGLSDTMSPGRFSSLGKNNDVAFRATFEADAPAMGDRYWRGLILDFFDGEEWSQQHRPDNIRPASLRDPQYQYQIMLEPHEKQWLFALANSVSSSENVGVKSDGTLKNRVPLISKRIYEVKSSGGSFIDQRTLSYRERSSYLQLPKGENPRTRAFVDSLDISKQAPIADAVRSLQTFFFQQEYRYTLNPPLIEGQNTIDRFLFESRAGFCGHYAGAVTFMFRSLGIPARVVAGYHGGEFNQAGNYYTIYQRDAHAWVEVHLKDKGWMRIDPTGWINPDRVERGLEDAVKDEYTGIRKTNAWMLAMYQQLQVFDYFWNDWMLNYKGEQQRALLEEIWGSDWSSVLWIVLTMLALLAVPIAYLLWDQRPAKKSYHQKLWQQYCKILLGSSDSYSSDDLTGKSFAHISKSLMQLHPTHRKSIEYFNHWIEDKLYGSSMGNLDRRDYQLGMSRLKRIKQELRHERIR